MDDETGRRLLERVEALVASQAAMSAAMAAMAAGQVPVAQPTITIRALFAEFEKLHSLDRSWRFNRNRLTPLVRLLGDRRACDLTPLLWAEHRAVRAGELDRYGKVPKPHTLNIELGRAKELLKFGVAHGFLRESALMHAKREKTISRRETWLDEDGLQLLLTGVEAISGELPQALLRAFILVCVDGMLRHNEARNLRRDSINREGVVELSAKVTKSRRRRTVVLTPRCLEAIAAVPTNYGDPRIFLNPTTKRLYSPMSFQLWFRTACAASGVDAMAVEGERVVIHTLRHSGASAADARGAQATAIRDAMGHAFLSTTEPYLHRHQAQGAKGLARLMHEGAELERRGPHGAPGFGSRSMPTEK